MDAYLRISEDVLRQARRPLGPRAILDLAYLSDLVPAHLYGKTQHKTLQARLSEDILLNRDRSVFFRCAPGRFFLREFMDDVSIPEEYRTPIVARRRTRDWSNQPALAFRKKDLLDLIKKRPEISRDQIYDLIHGGRYSYVDPKCAGVDDVLIWSFVVVVRLTSVLSYRVGQYREGRDAFFNKKTIGFYTLVSPLDSTLFDTFDAGIASSGLRAAKLDLDIVFTDATGRDVGDKNQVDKFIYQREETGPQCLLSLIRFDCPEWFEPMRRRLAINDLNWLDLSCRINDDDDFEPWSRSAIGGVRELIMGSGTPTE